MAHQTKDILIVDADATVTPVSGEAPTVTGATVEIHTEDVETESFMLDESICTEDNLKFGLCASSKVEITVRNKSEIPNLNGFETPLNIYIYLNGDSDTLFQIGQYLCDKDEYINERRLRKLVLYDVLYELNDLDVTSWYNQYFADGNRHEIIWVIADLFKWINGTSPYDNDSSSPKINLELDSEYILCNGMFPIGKTIESDTITFSFFMQGLLEFNGSFGHITREGKFKIVTMEWYDKDPVRIVTDDYRKPPTSYADEATWGIGGIDVYDRDNTIKFQIRNTDKKRPSIYVMLDPWVIADREAGDSYTRTALERLQSTIHHFNYTPSETECSGDLCVEVGDRIDVRFTKKSAYDTRNKFRSYVLERHFSGIQTMHDTYTSKGSKKQPAYQVNGNWHIGDSETATQGKGTGGVADVDMEHDRRLIQVLRNGGYRFLDEPSGVSVVYNKAQSQVEIKWTDPSDITDYKPLPAEWVGTCLIRKEGSAPLHRWDGELLVRSNTRNEYSSTAYVDDTIESNKRYYYSIMPYYIALDDEYHPVRYYTWTKIVSVDTARILVAPTILGAEVEGTQVNIAYTIPVLDVGTYAIQKLVGKKGSIPTSKTDGDISVDLVPDPTMIVNVVNVTGLDELSHYYFMVFVEDEEGNGASSEPQDCMTGELMEIDIFTNQFNQNILVDDWDLSVYRDGYGVANTSWQPLNFSSDYLSAYNFLIGNSERRPIINENGELKASRSKIGMTDEIFWIPIKRIYTPTNVTISFESLVAYGAGQYYYAGVLIAYVDENNGWHNVGYVEEHPGANWTTYNHKITGDYPYIDYIGLIYCDGQAFFKNIKIIPERE